MTLTPEERARQLKIAAALHELAVNGPSQEAKDWAERTKDSQPMYSEPGTALVWFTRGQHLAEAPQLQQDHSILVVLNHETCCD